MSKFSGMLVNLEKGKVANELDGAMGEVVQAITERGGKGSLTLTLSLKQAGGNAKVLEVAATVKKVLPDRSRAASVFFVGKDYNLQRNDPDQEELRLQISGGARDGEDIGDSRQSAKMERQVA